MGLDLYLSGRICPITNQDDEYPIEYISVRLGYWRGWVHMNLNNLVLETIGHGDLKSQPSLEAWLSSANLASIEKKIVVDLGKPEEDRLFDDETLQAFQRAQRWLNADTVPEDRSVFWVVSW